MQIPFRQHIGWSEIREHLAFLKQLRAGEAAPEQESTFAVMTTAVNNTAGRVSSTPLCRRVSVFLASDERHQHRVLDDVRVGWGDVARGGFAAYRVPGTDETILRHTNVRELAAKIAQEIGRSIP